MQLMALRRLTSRNAKMGLGQVVLQLFVLTVLMAPLDSLQSSQKCAVCWLLLWVSLWQSVFAEFPLERFLSEYEYSYLGVRAEGWYWRYQLATLWGQHILWLWLAVPFMGLLLQLPWDVLVYWALLWTVQSMVYALFAYALRVMSYEQTLGVWAIVCVMLPWVLPSALLMLEWVLAYETTGHSLAFVYAQCGWSLLGLGLLPYAIDAIRAQSYRHMRGGVRLL